MARGCQILLRNLDLRAHSWVKSSMPAKRREPSGAEQGGGGSVHFGILDAYPLGPICCGSRLCSASHCKICCLSSSLGRIWSMVKGLRLKGSVWSLCEHRSYRALENGMLQFGWGGEILMWVFLHSGKFSFCKHVNTCWPEKINCECTRSDYPMTPSSKHVQVLLALLEHVNWCLMATQSTMSCSQSFLLLYSGFLSCTE